jgi:mannose-6-phosphate isomerase-like protein (cupin superfamily)
MNFSADDVVKNVFDKVEAYLIQDNFTIVQKVADKPWGGYFLLDELQVEKFITKYFSNLLKQDLIISGKLSPKILVVAPNKKLSWQYHFRRAEIWKLIAGTAGIITSKTDKQEAIHILQMDEIIKIECGERHRLIGLENWGMVAEIWQHTEMDNPSNEEDIVRLEDDFGRE